MTARLGGSRRTVVFEVTYVLGVAFLLSALVTCKASRLTDAKNNAINAVETGEPDDERGSEAQEAERN